MEFNISEASFISGISKATLYAHIRKGILSTEYNGKIDDRELYYYMLEQWKLSRVLMYEPHIDSFERRAKFCLETRR